MMVIMALATTFMTTPLLEWIYPTAAAEPAVAEAGHEPGGYTVLACVAYDRSGPGMVTVAGALLGRTDDQSRLYALRLVPPTGRASFVLQQHDPERRASALEPLMARADELGLAVRPLSFVSQSLAADICEVADVKRADLVVLGWHKPVIGRAVLGGTVHEVMRRSRSDVAVLIDHGIGWINRVLVPYRGGLHDRAALELGLRFAEHAGANVTVLHIVRADPRSAAAPEAADLLLGGLGDERFAAGGRVTTKVVDHAEPAHAVLEECENGYDLVVIGAGADWGLEHRAFGLQPEPIVQECPTSLLIVRRAEAAGERALPTSAQSVPPPGLSAERA
jgi:nucleotide-binding universal stress UspA family protein